MRRGRNAGKVDAVRVRLNRWIFLWRSFTNFPLEMTTGRAWAEICSALCIVCFLGRSGIWTDAHPTHRMQPDNIEEDWWALGQKELARALDVQRNAGTAKNVIMFLGDGMGPSTVTAARFYMAQRRNVTISEALLEWERFPHVALARTYNTNQQTPDSSATATAFLCGEKAQSGTLGVNQHVIRGHCQTEANNAIKSILHHSHEAGKWTGLVTTARVTHATPAALYARSSERDWEADVAEEHRGACADIARQLVENNGFLRVILGGGRRSFLPKNITDPERSDVRGRRQDGRDLIQEWITRHWAEVSREKVRYVMDREEFSRVDEETVEYLMGLFDASHMQFEANRNNPEYETWGEPSLSEMTAKAIKILSRNKEKGFFLLVEGGRIDHGHHEGKAFYALSETVAMSDAVKMAVELTDIRDTLIVTTADHSHVFTMSGYSSINNDILGLANLIVEGNQLKQDIADDGLPFTTLGYANGPGNAYHRPNGSDISGRRRNLTKDAISGKLYNNDFLQDSTVPLRDEAHGGEDVAVYATGPMSHLLHGSHEQSYIAHVMMYASCVGPNQNHCYKEPSDTDRPVANAAFPILRSSAVELIIFTYLIGLFIHKNCI